ncbi:hypothetical protein [Luteimonas vadosa]|uniref:Uncharacterized protein n=1 Tax=Luteimonas vadosa TaxID=1165507 RepID=A0ABP9E4Y4_9GAMM
MDHPAPDIDAPLSAPAAGSLPREIQSASHAAGQADQWFPRALDLLLHHPALLVGVAYLGSALIGIWSSYWFYRSFGIPVVQYFQFSDFLIAGLRDPVSIVSLGALLAALGLSYLPTVYESRRPEAVRGFRRHWWGRLVFPKWGSPFIDRKWYELSPGTTLAIALVFGSGALIQSHARDKADALLAGGGQPIRLMLSGESRPLVGQARLLGTSSGYTFLYWPANGRTEVIAQGELGRIEVLPRRRYDPEAGRGE